ncbi:hypothetical protein [Paenibacillus sp. BAC0078]
MSKKRISNLAYPFYSLIIGVFVVLIFLFDYYAIKAGQLGDGIGIISLFYISPIGLVFGLMGLKNKKNRYVALLGIGINLADFLFPLYIMWIIHAP